MPKLAFAAKTLDLLKQILLSVVFGGRVGGPTASLN